MDLPSNTRLLALLAAACLCVMPHSARAQRNNLSRTPPMGWMSWEIFRCNVDCEADPHYCITEQMYKDQADAMVQHGILGAGYNHIHPDDCWMEKNPPRDPATGRLRGDLKRFPNGMKKLGDYIHGKGIKYAMYTAESAETCQGYPASENHEWLDAQTFADWGVDYLKVDGCGQTSYYPYGYATMGKALANVSRAIEYSCSWPAYIGYNESMEIMPTLIEIGCNGWRNYADIQCNWGSLSAIIDHWGQHGRALQPFAGPGHWHDMDTILAGNGCLTHDEERTQMAMWSISASPMILGNDMRNISAESLAIILNAEAISVSQDPLGQMGIRLSNNTAQQLWARRLANGDIAVALYNKASEVGPPIPAPPCDTWVHTVGGFYEPEMSNNLGSFANLAVSEAQAWCCNSTECAGFSYANASKSGFYKGQTLSYEYKEVGEDGYTKPSQVPPSTPPKTTVDIVLQFADLRLYGPVAVYDIWQQQDLGSYHGSYTAKDVPHHGTAFLRLTPLATGQ